MTNPGIKYEYTIRKDGLDNDVEKLVYFWQYGRWTECSVTCGTGKKPLTVNPRRLRGGPRGQCEPVACLLCPWAHDDGPGAPVGSDCVGHGLKGEAVCLFGWLVVVYLAVIFFFLSAFYTVPHERFCSKKGLHVF